MLNTNGRALIQTDDKTNNHNLHVGEKSEVTIIRAFPVEQRLVPSVPLPFPPFRENRRRCHTLSFDLPHTHESVLAFIARQGKESAYQRRTTQLRVGTVFCIFPIFFKPSKILVLCLRKGKNKRKRRRGGF